MAQHGEGETVVTTTDDRVLDFDERHYEVRTGQERDATIAVYLARGTAREAERQDGTMELRFVTGAGLIATVCCVPYADMMRLASFVRRVAAEYREQDQLEK